MENITTDILLDEIGTLRAELSAAQRTRFNVLIRDMLVNYAALPPVQQRRVLNYLVPKFSVLHK